MLPSHPLAAFVVGYALTVAIETPPMAWGMSPRHRPWIRWTAAAILTAATYPLVALVLPSTLIPQLGFGGYLAVAETIAIGGESWLVGSLVGDVSRRDRIAVAAANAVSFLVGAAMQAAFP